MKGLEQKLNGVIEGVNQHLGLLFKNEREIGNLVYTNSVRIAVVRRLLREKLGVDDTAFDALVSQELAKREAEQKELEAQKLEEAKNRAVEEAAKTEGVPVDPDSFDRESEETLEFGGDFGEEHSPNAGVGTEESDQDRADQDGE